ncbi:MAG: hypothetical protein LBB52_03990 [Desulfovibrio sp.]|jgi:hypothetical protein|nr:hypothetical protein [Desulfovibrio sp.]
MAIAYQYTADGYFACATEDYGLLPNNATHTPAPDAQEGYIRHWTGAAWEQVENHKGQQGYLDGKPHTIIRYGPYPGGWSTMPPPLTPAELAKQRRTEILARLAEIDAASIRPLRASAQDEAVQADHDKLAALDAEAATLRTELAGLPAGSPE